MKPEVLLLTDYQKNLKVKNSKTRKMKIQARIGIKDLLVLLGILVALLIGLSTQWASTDNIFLDIANVQDLNKLLGLG